MIDEYSRFPFAFPCHDMTASTVINCLENVFSMFGTASFIHSDRGSSFLSKTVKDYLYVRGVAASTTTPYNPQGNGQVEKLNDTLWKAINVSLKGQNICEPLGNCATSGSSLHQISSVYIYKRDSTQETFHIW